MSTGLRLLHLSLAVGTAVLVLGGVREMIASDPLPPPPAPRPGRPAPTVASPADPPMPGGYGVIAAKNLFNPGRTEAPAAAAVATGPTPTLHGVVMDGAKSRAYLEDPAQKRTFGYLVGDPVGGGRVESIAADRVLIGRGDGAVEVLLRDPAKPRPSGRPTTGVAAPGPNTDQSGAVASSAVVHAPAPASPGTQAASPASAARTDR